MYRGVHRWARLAEMRSNGRGDAASPRRRLRASAAAGPGAAADDAPRDGMAAQRALSLGCGGAQVERLGAGLQPRAPAGPHVVARHARRRLAEAHRGAVHLPRRDDGGAARLVAAPPDASRPGAEGLAEVLPQARGARRGALGTRRTARLCRARGARAACGAPPDPAHRRALHRAALRRERQQAWHGSLETPGAPARDRMRLGLASLLVAVAGPAFGQGFVERPEVQAFIGEVVERHGFVEGELKKVFSRVQRVEPALQSIVPVERPSWDDYRAQFVNEKRVNGGRAFWKANRTVLKRAARRYGVPAQYIVAIIGVETNYGRNMGRYRVIDALATLAFDYPPRARFFRGELEQYLLLAREARLDVFARRGAHAGASGIPQFMPTSLRRYAVDFNGDGRIDLTGSSADAGGSVANFLKEHGWPPGEAGLHPRQPSSRALARFVSRSVEPRHRIADLLASGLELEAAPPVPFPAPDALGVLVALGAEYRVGLQNFYVITRYNRSALYASAVNDLADALAERAPVAGK